MIRELINKYAFIIWFIFIGLPLLSVTLSGCATIYSGENKETGEKYIRAVGFTPIKGAIEDRSIETKILPDLPLLKIEP